MSDLIDRDALMKEFAMFVQRSNNDDYAPAPIWNDAVSLVGSMPSAEPERKWIPVTERLPEEDKDVLVFGVEAISNEYVYGVKRLDVDTWRPRIAPSIRWIAWMPLPEPWGGE